MASEVHPRRRSLKAAVRVANVLNLAIEPGFATRSIDYLQLRLQSLCETKMWEGTNLYRDRTRKTSTSKVQFDESTISKYLFSSQSTSSSGELNLQVNNPDQYVLWPDDDVSDALMNQHLKLVRLQYRLGESGSRRRMKHLTRRIKSSIYFALTRERKGANLTGSSTTSMKSC